MVTKETTRSDIHLYQSAANRISLTTKEVVIIQRHITASL